MKRILTSVVLTVLLMSGTAFAAIPNAVNKAQFDAVRFSSTGPDDVVTITRADTTFAYVVLINVERMSFTTPQTGVNISNCGEIKHINKGSSAICTLYADRPPVTISSDTQGVAAGGNYQVQMYN